jgi:hypothetical protein
MRIASLRGRKRVQGLEFWLALAAGVNIDICMVSRSVKKV